MPDLSQLMPGTDGINFYTADPDLAFLLHRTLHELERITYEQFAIAACSHRAGALDWPTRVPQPVKFALGYLGMQAEDELQQGAMFLTEKQGGSDVGLTLTVARPLPDQLSSSQELQPQWEIWTAALYR